MTESKNILVELCNGTIIGIDVIVNLTVDSNYGADYDGNRGHKAVFVEDYSWTSNIRLNKLDESHVEKQVERFMEKYK